MQITPKIHAINIPFTVATPAGPIQRSVNVFLYLGAKITLVDSGVAGSEDRIFDYLRGLGRKPEDIGHLILTHSHPDHIGAARAVKAVTGCRLSAHFAERHWIEDTDLQQRERPVPGFDALVDGPVLVNQYLYDGKAVLLEPGAWLEVIHTPGHSAGSISLLCPTEQVLFCGDAIPLPGDMPIFDDYHAAIDSLLRLEKVKAEWLLSSWDEPKQGAAGRRAVCESLCWMEKIGEEVRSASRAGAVREPMELCSQVVRGIGLPPFAVNPLVARSLVSCLA